MSKQLLRLLPGTGLLALVVSCSFGLDPDEDLFACKKDADCGEGFVCVTPYDNLTGKPLAPRCVTQDTCVSTQSACNGRDDDCDGDVDEEDEVSAELAELAAQDPGPFLQVDKGANCHVNDPRIDGACQEGVVRCVEGKAACVNLGLEEGELLDDTCNDIDDDCNEIVDDTVNKDSDNENCGTCGNVCGAGLKCSGGRCVEEACGDGLDNDDNGKADCLDDDCAGKICGSQGRVCTNHACPKPCGDEPDGEISCNDGRDNDCSGQKDCADIHCLGRICDSVGGNCGRIGGQLGCRAQETDCGNGLDDDGDGDIDCLDSACNGQTCAEGKNCGVIASGADPECVPVESDCTNQVDDDGDGLQDCSDPDCRGLACNSSQPNLNCGLVNSETCVERETACIDGQDNDGDTFADCMDSDCDRKSCGTGCECREGRAQEIDCTDAEDNNQDGFKDCADLGSCLGKSCGDGCVCVQVGSRGQPRELICNDGLNNDRDDDGVGNVLVDCRDPDCAGESCKVDGGPDCTCAPCPGGVCPLGEGSFCANGIDDDGDQLADCADPDCDRKGCLGRVGCICENGVPSEAPDKCFDGQDNDDDGLTDCADPDCEGDSCGAGCECASGAKTEAGSACLDGKDNDGDGVADCEDSDCNGDSCGQGCTCVYDFETETGRKSETNCKNATDNDGDTLVDCNDPDCNALDCADAGCTCVYDFEAGSGSKTETLCNDGLNNDSPVDQLIDCEDGDCAGEGCGTGVDPSELTDCICEGGFAREVDCSNGADDDLDQKQDCDDSDCAGVSPCPGVVAASPANGPAAGGQTVTVFGTNFGIDENGDQTKTIDAIRFGGTACANPSWVSETEASCAETPAHGAGAVAVEVENPGGFTGTHDAAYTYTTHLGSGIDDCQLLDQNVNATAGENTDRIAGRVKEIGETDKQVSDTVIGNIGYGPDGSDPRTDGSWSWFASTVDAVNDDPLGDWDDHGGSFKAPAAGTYALMYRFSMDGGVKWLYCDASAADGFQTGKLTTE